MQPAKYFHLFLKIAFTCCFVLGIQQVYAQGEFKQKKALKKLRSCLDQENECQAMQDSIFKNAFAQLSIEEYAELQLEVSYLYFKTSDFIASKKIIALAEYIADSIQDPLLKAECYRRYSLLHFFEGRLDSAQIVLEKALAIYNKHDDTTKLALVIIFHGQILKERGFYSNALEEYLKSLVLFRQMKDTIYEANVLGEMATIYAVTGANEKAIDYGKKAAEIFKNMPSAQSSYAYISLNLANNLNYAEKPDSAIVLLEEVIPIFEKAKDTYLLKNALAQLGRAHYKKNDIQLALAFLEQSNALDPEEQYIGQSIYNYQLMGRMYRDKQNLKQALYYFRKSHTLHNAIGFNDELKTLLEDLATTYELLNQNDSALKYFKAYQEVSDSLFTIERENKLNELKARYETDLRDEQLRNNAREIGLLEKSNAAKSQRNITLLVILIVVLVLGAFVINRQRQVIKIGKLLAIQSKKTYQAELQVKASEKQQLEKVLEHRKKELANQALLIAEKNELIRSFRNEVNNVGIQDKSSKHSLHTLSLKMERAENQQSDWDKFMELFKDVHPTLLSEIAKVNPNLTHNDLRLLALMKMGFSNKEIAEVQHVTEGALKKARYRLRKKLNLEAHSNLHQFLQNI